MQQVCMSKIVKMSVDKIENNYGTMSQDEFCLSKKKINKAIDELYEKNNISLIRKVIKLIEGNNDDPYFINEKQKYIFCLNKVDGERRNEYIGLNDQLYEDKLLAKDWYRSIVKVIHPDENAGDDDAEEAFINLTKLYENICDSFEGDENE